jgi:hypothetical protein
MYYAIYLYFLVAKGTYQTEAVYRIYKKSTEQSWEQIVIYREKSDH